MRLTDPLNLPAPGRSQTLYVGLSPSQSPVFLVNSRYRRFIATLIGFVCTTTPTEGTPSSEVTVSICLVPWRRVLSGALGFSPHPPVSDYGTDTLQTPCGIFLGSVVSTTVPLRGRHRLSEITASPFDRTRHPYGFGPAQPPSGSPNLLRRPSVQRLQDGAGILTCFPSPTPFGLGLGSG